MSKHPKHRVLFSCLIFDGITEVHPILPKMEEKYTRNWQNFILFRV